MISKKYKKMCKLANEIIINSIKNHSFSFGKIEINKCVNYNDGLAFTLNAEKSKINSLWHFKLLWEDVIGDENTVSIKGRVIAMCSLVETVCANNSGTTTNVVINVLDENMDSAMVSKGFLKLIDFIFTNPELAWYRNKYYVDFNLEYYDKKEIKKLYNQELKKLEMRK